MRTICRLALLLMAQCAKHFRTYGRHDGSTSGLQRVSIADDFATVVVTGTIVEDRSAHDCACFAHQLDCFTDCIFFF
jgi:hypothetical protein